MKVENKLIYAVIVVTSLLIIVTYYVAYGEESADGYWLVPDINNNYEYRYIPVYYVDEVFYCEYKAYEARGCYVNKPSGEYIKIVESMEFDWANQGCTVHDHEFYHAMGYEHGIGLLSTTCPNPNSITEDNTNMKFDPDNPFHFVLNEKYVPKIKEFNPCIHSWYVSKDNECKNYQKQ